MFEELTKMATTFRQYKEHYTEDEMQKIQDNINFLLEKMQKFNGKPKDIVGKLTISAPIPVYKA